METITMNWINGWVAARALAALVLAPPTPTAAADSASARVRLVGLGTLGGDYNSAHAINGRGDVAGVSSTPQGDGIDPAPPAAAVSDQPGRAVTGESRSPHPEHKPTAPHISPYSAVTVDT